MNQIPGPGGGYIYSQQVVELCSRRLAIVILGPPSQLEWYFPISLSWTELRLQRTAPQSNLCCFWPFQKVKPRAFRLQRSWKPRKVTSKQPTRRMRLYESSLISSPVYVRTWSTPSQKKFRQAWEFHSASADKSFLEQPVQGSMNMGRCSLGLDYDMNPVTTTD